MSVGGFLAVLEDAAAARGLAARIDLFTIEELAAGDSGASFSSPVAEVRITPSAALAGSGYPDAISGATVKANLAAVSLPPAQLRPYLEMNAQQRIELRFVQDAGSLADLKPILKAAFRLEMENEPTLMESYRLMRRNRRQKVAGRARRSGACGAQRASTRRWTMLFQRLWLKAIQDGFAVVPASQALQEYAAMAEHYRGIHRAFAAPGQSIQMIAFLGRPKDGYRRGFRLSVKDLVRQP